MSDWNWSLIFSGIEALATAGAAFVIYFAWKELDQTERHAATAFEDGLSQEYRDIIANLPVEVLLDQPVTECQYKDARIQFYRYFDLCNTQIFLRQKERVRENTWYEWCDGIKSNLKKTAFKRAWKEVDDVTKESENCSFGELRKLIGYEYRGDPCKWVEKTDCP